MLATSPPGAFESPLPSPPPLLNPSPPSDVAPQAPDATPDSPPPPTPQFAQTPSTPPDDAATSAAPQTDAPPEPAPLHTPPPPPRIPHSAPSSPPRQGPGPSALPGPIMGRSESLRNRAGMPGPMQRFFTETPASSMLHGMHHRDAEHPVNYMPPSPPLTRNSSTPTRSPSAPAAPSARAASAAPTVTPTVHTAASGSGAGSTTHANDVPIHRSATTGSSSTSSKEQRRALGKSLGASPVDYLIPNGSIERPVSQYFSPTHDPFALDIPAGIDLNEPEKCPPSGLFKNLHTLLDNYMGILTAGGSIAVGTGYRSVARRLLDRVEGMFARDLGIDGITWTEILEYLRGTRPKPKLCILPVRGLISRGGDESVINTTAPARAVSPPRQPMGKVEKWLYEVEQQLKSEEQNFNPAPDAPPRLTREEMEEMDRMVIKIIEQILLSDTTDDHIARFREFLEMPTLIENARLALERLYPDHPKESITTPIVALYLVMNPPLHPLLAAMASITSEELDLLNSGRFDAFLDGSSKVVAQDEDEELAVISRLDKRLWSVLEGLEDEIEDLHNRALIVRRALKARKENIVTQRRKGPIGIPGGESLLNIATTNNQHQHQHHHTHRSTSPGPKSPTIPDDRNSIPPLATPTVNIQAPVDLPPIRPPETDDDWAHNVPALNLPITPDDSASNIDFARRRRHHERISSTSGGGGTTSTRRSATSASKKEKRETGTGMTTNGPVGKTIAAGMKFGGGVLESIMGGGSEAGESTMSKKKKKREGSRVRSADHGHRHKEKSEEERERRREKKREREREKESNIEAGG
ncbi:hypothetical protein EX30DRAFT_264482 [Ascodesmis nigricans]|uniref:Uncharacterized protein n=1 Tax=Ascodesmis nigricans TaxID=341454 RepID=A0A4S2MXV4_9PEZI|nr:hypothetical protein EX30DRAFT_264482 [Ascodesmis nigricans]